MNQIAQSMIYRCINHVNLIVTSITKTTYSNASDWIRTCNLSNDLAEAKFYFSAHFPWKKFCGRDNITLLHDRIKITFTTPVKVKNNINSDVVLFQRQIQHWFISFGYPVSGPNFQWFWGLISSVVLKQSSKYTWRRPCLKPVKVLSPSI